MTFKGSWFKTPGELSNTCPTVFIKKLMCVCMAGRSGRSFLRSSCQGGSRQLRAAGHPLPRHRAVPLGVDRLKALHCAVVIHQDATLLERPGARLFRSALVSFAQQDIIVAQPRHSAAPSCVCGLLCTMLSSVFKWPCCSRRVSQPWRGVRDVSCLLVGGCLCG